MFGFDDRFSDTERRPMVGSELALPPLLTLVPLLEQQCCVPCTTAYMTACSVMLHIHPLH